MALHNRPWNHRPHGFQSPDVLNYGWACDLSNKQVSIKCCSLDICWFLEFLFGWLFLSVCFDFICFSKSGFHNVAQADHRLMAILLPQRPSTGITDMCHYNQIWSWFQTCYSEQVLIMLWGNWLVVELLENKGRNRTWIMAMWICPFNLGLFVCLICKIMSSMHFFKLFVSVYIV